MRAASLVIGLFAAATLSSACHAQIFDDPFSQYFERGVTITPGAGIWAIAALTAVLALLGRCDPESWWSIAPAVKA